jgi:secreted PhoX family phosphatase
MRKVFTLVLAFLAFLAVGFSQTDESTLFPESIDPGDFLPNTVVLPQSPFSMQVLFIGGYDTVQTRKGEAIAKQWHDFIGFTPDTVTGTSDLGWVSVNHEMILADDKIGDGGGMTVFKVKRNADGTVGIVEQLLNDGRAGKFFNVDFAGTVGETGMNCGGISSVVDGRIWTAEEWFRYTTNSIYSGGNGVRDTAFWTIDTDIVGDFDGQTVQKKDNFNYMVEIDPRQGEAIRKQYNWGRQGFEGGAIMPDNKTVYLGEDSRPGLFSKFVANTPGDFTSGNLYVYGYNETTETGEWIQVDNTKLDSMLAMNAYNGAMPWRKGAVMFDRIEWVKYHNGKIYFTETGNDGFWDEFYRFRDGDSRRDDPAFNGKLDNHWLEVARIRYPALAGVSNDSVRKWLLTDNADLSGRGNFIDAHGRVCVYDPATNLVSVFIEGGPYPGDLFSSSEALGAGYPEKHMSNPDGLGFISPAGSNKTFMLINEDLNGTSYNRTPAGVSNRTCELWALDMDITNPTINDLIRISIVPRGAEVTGAQQTPDGLSLLVNSQHPSTSNPFPFNNSLTYAINGWDKLAEIAERRVAGLALYDADTDTKIADIAYGDTVSVPNLEDRNLALVAVMEPYDINGSVAIDITGPISNYKVENVAPYASFGDKSGNFNGKKMMAGYYTVVCTPNDKKNRSGSDGIDRMFKFQLKNSTAVTETFKLYDGVADTLIAEITQGAEIAVAGLSTAKLNVVAELKTPNIAQSVKLQLTGPTNKTKTENVAPYAVFGDKNGNFNGKYMPAGAYTIKATPYTQKKAKGMALSSSMVNFTLVEKYANKAVLPMLAAQVEEVENPFTAYPNPVIDALNFNKTVSVAIYNEIGQRIAVYRDVKQISVSDFRSKLSTSTFFIKAEGEEKAVRVVLGN